MLNVALCITLTGPSSFPPLSFCWDKYCTFVGMLYSKQDPVSVATAPVVVVQCILASVPFCFVLAGAISFKIVAIFVCCCAVPAVPSPVTSNANAITSKFILLSTYAFVATS